MIRLLPDEGLAPAPASLLRASGVDALHISETHLHPAQDPTIIEYARNEGRACVTLDHDFHAHLAHGGYVSPTVLLIRAESLRAPQQAAIILSVLAAYRNAFLAGSAITADQNSVRVRPLPLR